VIVLLERAVVDILARVLGNLINANPRLNVEGGFFLYCLKAFPVLILNKNLKAA